MGTWSNPASVSVATASVSVSAGSSAFPDPGVASDKWLGWVVYSDARSTIVQREGDPNSSANGPLEIDGWPSPGTGSYIQVYNNHTSSQTATVRVTHK